MHSGALRVKGHPRKHALVTSPHIPSQLAACARGRARTVAGAAVHAELLGALRDGHGDVGAGLREQHPQWEPLGIARVRATREEEVLLAICARHASWQRVRVLRPSGKSHAAIRAAPEAAPSSACRSARPGCARRPREVAREVARAARLRAGRSRPRPAARHARRTRARGVRGEDGEEEGQRVAPGGMAAASQSPPARTSLASWEL